MKLLLEQKHENLHSQGRSQDPSSLSFEQAFSPQKTPFGTGEL